jgi:hypothetical protein
MLSKPQNCRETVGPVQQRIRAAALASGRNVDCVTLVAVSKTQPVEAIEAVAHAGIESFGENYLQEALPKIEALASLELTWHFIGQIQGNKTRPIAESFAWAHGVDRLKIAQRLSEQRPFHAAPLNICLQVNIAGEATKAGASPAELPALVESVRSLPRLRLRGLMCIPPEEAAPERQRHWFRATRQLFDTLNEGGAQLDTLSMGMSGDFEMAIAEGSTLVRIGSAIFGQRPQKPA